MSMSGTSSPALQTRSGTAPTGPTGRNSHSGGRVLTSNRAAFYPTPERSSTVLPSAGAFYLCTLACDRLGGVFPALLCIPASILAFMASVWLGGTLLVLGAGLALAEARARMEAMR